MTALLFLQFIIRSKWSDGAIGSVMQFIARMRRRPMGNRGLQLHPSCLRLGL